MANAADYLLLDTTQLLNTYKLRTRNIESRSFTARNIAPNYILSVLLTSNLDGITFTPAAFVLQPDESITVSVRYDTAELEALAPGTVEGSFDISVSASPIVVPQIPISPPAPDLPEAPRQIVSRIQVRPTNFTLSEVNETNQFEALLYVDDVPTPATFAWSLENDKSEAFLINATSGIVKALKSGVYKATVKAKLLTPTQYIGTEGLGIVAANIPIILPVGGEPVPTTGNLTVVINGVRGSVNANVTISGLNQSITKTTTFNNIQAGTYTVTPNVVTVGGVNYNPTGGGEIVVPPGQNAEITIQYTKQALPTVNSIKIDTVVDSAGNVLERTGTVKVGDRITVTAITYNNGNPANIGDVQFTANNTQEGKQLVQGGRTDGTYKVTFTITEPGEISITAFNQAAGSVTGQLTALRASNYVIKFTAPKTLITGQCSPVTAVVLRDGVETNIPVEINVSGGSGLIGTEPCGVADATLPQPTLVTPPAPPPPQPQPTFTEAVEVVPPQPTATGTAGGGTIVNVGTGGGATSGGGFNDIFVIDQGQNAI